MNTSLVWLIGGAIIIVGGAWFLFTGGASAPVPDEGDVTINAGGNSGVFTTDMAPLAETVTYDGSGFSPNAIAVKKGGTVTFVNASGGNMWVASAMHPTHSVYSGTERAAHCPDTVGTAFDQCAGEVKNFSFTFNKAGNWNFHDHLNPSAFGRVLVVE